MMSESVHDFSNEAYGEIAALRYNIFESRSSGFARRMAPRIHAFYEQAGIGMANQRLLDVACGTGQLASYFLEREFEVVGLDRSPYMLNYARANNAEYVARGQARFDESEANKFHLEQQFGIAVCTFNGLNHLASFEQVVGCMASVHGSLIPGGYFIFDINTLLGLKRVVEVVDLVDTDDDIVMRKRIFDGNRVILYASGCFLHEGAWNRYRETIYKIVIDTNELRKSMLENGWSSVTFTTDDFTTVVDDPEMEQVAYVVARRNF